jgi:hypothetical protein
MVSARPQSCDLAAIKGHAAFINQIAARKKHAASASLDATITV